MSDLDRKKIHPELLRAIVKTLWALYSPTWQQLTPLWLHVLGSLHDWLTGMAWRCQKFLASASGCRSPPEFIYLTRVSPIDQNAVSKRTSTTTIASGKLYFLLNQHPCMKIYIARHQSYGHDLYSKSLMIRLCDRKI